MAPRVQLPTLRAFLGAIALTKTTTRTASRLLYKLQGGLTENDVAVREVVNAAIDALDGIGNAYAWARFSGSHDTGVSTTVAVAASGATPVGFSISSGVLTAEKAGIYSIRVAGDVDYNNDPVVVTLLKSGDSVATSTTDTGASAARVGFAIEAIVELAAGSTVSVTVTADAAAVINPLRVDLVLQKIGPTP